MPAADREGVEPPVLQRISELGAEIVCHGASVRCPIASNLRSHWRPPDAGL